MFNIDQRSHTPIYQQLVQEIKKAVLTGVLRPGDRLPSVRELAVRLMINPNTIQKSYQELERQKVIETLRGRGTFVATAYKPRPDEERLLGFKQDMRRLLVEAHYLGLDSDQVLALVRQLWKELQVRGGDY